MAPKSRFQQAVRKHILILRLSADLVSKSLRWVSAERRDWYQLLFVEEDVSKLYGKLMAWTRFTGGVPLEYDQRSGKFLVVAGGHVWYFLIMGAIAGFRLFVALIGCLTDWRIWDDLLVKGVINANHLITLVPFGMCLGTSPLYWLAWQNSYSVMFGINFARFNEVTFRELFGQGVPRTHIQLQRSWAFVLLLVPAGIVGTIWAYSTPHVWSIKLSENLFSGNVGPVTNWVCCLLDIWLLLYGTLTLYWLSAVVFLTFFSVVDVMTALRLQTGRVDERLRMYKIVKICVGILDSNIRQLIPVGIFGICLITALANYIVLNIRYLLSFGYLATSIGFFVVVCVLTAQMYATKMFSWIVGESEEFLEELRQKLLQETPEDPSRARFFQKRLRAMQPLYLNCGDFFKIGKNYHVTHLSLLLDQSSNLLLTYKCA